MERLLITGVRYADFERLTKWHNADGRRAVRFAYNQGNLEILVVTNTHERFKKIVALLIEAWIDEDPEGELRSFPPVKDSRTCGKIWSVGSSQTNVTTSRTGKRYLVCERLNFTKENPPARSLRWKLRSAVRSSRISVWIVCRSMPRSRYLRSGVTTVNLT